MINLTGEMPKSYTGADIDIFKQLTGGDLLEINKKYKNAYSQVYTGRLWLLSNFMLNVSDGTKAMMDRLICIPFDAVFDKENGDNWKERKEMLDSEEAKQYFLYLAISGLKRYRENNGYTKSERSEKLKCENKEFNNPVYTFIKYRLTLRQPVTAQDGISGAELYRQFKLWWLEEGLGHTIMSKKNFNQACIELGFDVSVCVWSKVKGENIRGLRMIQKNGWNKNFKIYDMVKEINDKNLIQEVFDEDIEKTNKILS